jgi:hypothetical protein
MTQINIIDDGIFHKDMNQNRLCDYEVREYGDSKEQVG